MAFHSLATGHITHVTKGYSATVVILIGAGKWQDVIIKPGSVSTNDPQRIGYYSCCRFIFFNARWCGFSCYCGMSVMHLKLSKEEAERWELFLNGKSRKANTWNRPSLGRQAKAVKLFLKYGSKSYVCDKLHMGRNTLNSILKDAGVV